jgi:hypothetical protein
VSYFVRRAAGWNTCPILYPFLREGLCDAAVIERCIVAPLLALLARFEAQGLAAASVPAASLASADLPRVSAAVAGCARSSLLALQSFRWLSRCGDMGLDEGLLRPTQAALVALRAHARLLDPVGSQEGSRPGAAPEDARGLAPLPRRHGRHLRAWSAMVHGDPGVLDLGLPHEGLLLLPPSAAVLRFAACVHAGGGRAAWGPLRATAAEARADRLALQLALERDADPAAPRAAALANALAALKGGTSGGGGGLDAPAPKVKIMDVLFGEDSDSD